MKRLVLAFLLLPGVALAQQQPPMQQQIDTAEATVTRILTGFGNQIASDAAMMDRMQQQIAALQKQAADLTVERDKLKAADAKSAADAPK